MVVIKIIEINFILESIYLNPYYISTKEKPGEIKQRKKENQRGGGLNAIVKEKVFILKDNRRTLILSQNNAENHLVQCVEGIVGSRYGFSGNCHTKNEKSLEG